MGNWPCRLHFSAPLVSWLLAEFGQRHAPVGGWKVGERKKPGYFSPLSPSQALSWTESKSPSFSPAPPWGAHCGSSVHRWPPGLQYPHFLPLSHHPIGSQSPCWRLSLRNFSSFLWPLNTSIAQVTTSPNSLCCVPLKCFLLSCFNTPWESGVSELREPHSSKLYHLLASQCLGASVSSFVTKIKSTHPASLPQSLWWSNKIIHSYTHEYWPECRESKNREQNR